MYATELIHDARRYAQEGFKKSDTAEDIARFALILWKLDKALAAVKESDDTIRALHETGYIEQCQGCGEWHHVDWITEGWCDDCLESTHCSSCSGTGEAAHCDPGGPYSIPCPACSGSGKYSKR